MTVCKVCFKELTVFYRFRKWKNNFNPSIIPKQIKQTFDFSENFIPGRTPVTRILKTIHLFDFKRAEIVSHLLEETERDIKRLVSSQISFFSFKGIYA